eukprot:scaffold20432_cov108-Cylindrotheca_fusiformis.AAC.4
MEEFIAFIEDRLEATEDLTQLANERETSKRKKKSANDNGSDNNRKKTWKFAIRVTKILGLDMCRGFQTVGIRARSM